MNIFSINLLYELNKIKHLLDHFHKWDIYPVKNTQINQMQQIGTNLKTSDEL